MIPILRSLRVRLAILGALVIYLPVLLVFTVSSITEREQTEIEPGGAGWTLVDTTVEPSGWAVLTVVALGPIAVALAWWWSGRAVRPLERIRAAAEHIEASDLSLRIGLERGPSEVVALAAGFDAMLDRLERSATVQRRLIEETSHELRAPLSVLVTNAEVLLDHPSPSLALYREGLERTQTAAERLRATLGELLVDARGRARTIDRQPTDLRVLAQEVLDEFVTVASAKSVRLVLGGAEVAECAADEPTLRRAVTNLVDNAVKHSPRSSTVEVDVDRSPTDVGIAVTDHGPGIAVVEQARVFERFWRSGDAPGTGLGLPIARQIALAHGGDLTLASPGPSGDGCCFRLLLPTGRSAGDRSERDDSAGH